MAPTPSRRSRACEGQMPRCPILLYATRYDLHGKALLKTNPKEYVVDTGFGTWMADYGITDTGRLFENAAYLQLLYEGWSVHVGKLYGKEVDFVATRDERVLYVQATDEMFASETREREIAPLKSMWVDARFLSPRAEWGRFGTREIQIELNGLFGGLRTAFPRLLMGSKESRHLRENGSNQWSAHAIVRAVLEKPSQAWYIDFGGRFGYLQVPGAYPPAFILSRGFLLGRDLSIFVDESGDRGGKARYYLLTLVIHDQADSISDKVARYEESLLRSDLPNIPFHSEPLLNGHGPYRGMSLEQRKKMLYSFNVLVQRLPIKYATFAYRRSEFDDLAKLTARMKRDISGLLFDHLDFFQAFDDVKVYYDNGQNIVKRALDQSFGFALSKGVLERRKTSMTDYRLEQAADYLCTIELAAIKYAAKEDGGGTYNKFFGGIGPFKRNWLKQARRKAI